MEGTIPESIGNWSYSYDLFLLWQCLHWHRSNGHGAYNETFKNLTVDCDVCCTCCFTGSVLECQTYVERDCFLSLSGFVFRVKTGRECPPIQCETAQSLFGETELSQSTLLSAEQVCSLSMPVAPSGRRPCCRCTNWWRLPPALRRRF